MAKSSESSRGHFNIRCAIRAGVVWCGIILASLALMGSSCPTYEPPLPPRLTAPVFKKALITGYWSPSTGAVLPAIRVAWFAPDTDSISVGTYTLMRKVQGDSAFSVLKRAIPRDIGQYYDVTDGITVPHSSYRDVMYRIFAVDSLGRSGDTSGIDTVTLANTARLMNPLDTLRGAYFEWTIMGSMYALYTYMFLWDSTGLRWQSPKPALETYLSEYQTDSTAVRMPDSLTPLHPGTYYWGAMMDIVNGRRDITTGSIAIGSFYVP